MVLATQTLLQRKPRTYEVRVDGRLRPGVSAKDIILALIARIGIGGGTGHVFEYRGEAIRALTMEQRMTICNMSIEGGARAGLVAPDDTTFDYLHGRRHAPQGAAWDAAVAGWRTLPTDDGATFDRSIVLDADDARAHGHLRHQPGHGHPDHRPRPAPRGGADDPTRRGLERALEYMGLTPGEPIAGQPVDVVFIGVVHEQPDQRPAARGVGAQGPPRRGRRPADDRAGLAAGEGAGRARGPARDLPGGRRRVARVRLLDVHRDERRPAVAGAVRDQHVQPQLRGPPGQGRPHVPRVARSRPPRRRSPAS